MLDVVGRSGLFSEEMERSLIGIDAVSDTPSLLEWVGNDLRRILPGQKMMLALCPSESREWRIHHYPDRQESSWVGDHPIQDAIRELTEAGPHDLGACLPDDFGSNTVWVQPLRTPQGELLRALLLESSDDELNPISRDWLVYNSCLVSLLVGRFARMARLAFLEKEVQELEFMKSSFMDTVSHELKTPLTSIIGFASLALSQAGIEQSPPLPEFLTAIHDAGLQLERLINEVLVMSNMASAEHSIELEEYKFGDLILEFEDTCLPRLAESERVDISTEDRSIEVKVDRHQLLRTLEHLITNSLKFSDSDTRVELSWSFIHGRRHGDDTDFLRIDVKDYGIGIYENELERVFDRFYQVDSSSTREKGGTGLGLALAKEFVEAMGGKLWGESEPGKGSQFSFTIQAPRS